jgi:hypothetical protein
MSYNNNNNNNRSHDHCDGNDSSATHSLPLSPHQLETSIAALGGAAFSGPIRCGRRWPPAPPNVHFANTNLAHQHRPDAPPPGRIAALPIVQFAYLTLELMASADCASL